MRLEVRSLARGRVRGFRNGRGPFDERFHAGREAALRQGLAIARGSLYRAGHQGRTTRSRHEDDIRSGEFIAEGPEAPAVENTIRGQPDRFIVSALDAPAQRLGFARGARHASWRVGLAGGEAQAIDHAIACSSSGRNCVMAGMSCSAASRLPRESTWAP